MEHRKTILITGASSGIGRACALAFDKLGYHVFASVRKDADAEDLKKEASSNLETFLMDLGRSEDIQAVALTLSKRLANQGLDVLINNAGAAYFAPIEAVSRKQMMEVFNSNFFGAVELTQQLLPLLRISKGRIVNISSVGGLTTIPYGFVLCASKYAMESFNAGLRLELAPWGIRVIAINPSDVASAAAKKMLGSVEQTISKMSDDHRRMYEESFMQMATSMSKHELSGIKPEEVAKVIVKAVEAKYPKTRYAVGTHARLLTLLSGILPDRLFDKLKLRLIGIQS